MQKSNIDILNHFYSVLIDMNFHRPEETVWDEKDYRTDPFINKNLQKIRLLNAKYKALRSRSMYNNLITEVKRLKEFGFEKIQQLLTSQEAEQLQPLFSKFEQISKEDEASIEEDQELLQLLKILKDKVDKLSPDE